MAQFLKKKLQRTAISCPQINVLSRMLSKLRFRTSPKSSRAGRLSQPANRSRRPATAKLNYVAENATRVYCVEQRLACRIWGSYGSLEVVRNVTIR